jgi:cytochrome subunit of sulfide dehydrogenase
MRAESGIARRPDRPQRGTPSTPMFEEMQMHHAFRRSAALTALLGAFGLAQAQDAQLARSLAATCANCHGTNGQARGDMKPLAGVSAEKIVAAVADYKSGAQPATIMHQIAKGYTDEQIKLLAAYFAAQPARK